MTQVASVIQAGVEEFKPNSPTSGNEDSTGSFEDLELRYGAGGFEMLDSDDIDALIAANQAWMPGGAL